MDAYQPPNDTETDDTENGPTATARRFLRRTLAIGTTVALAAGLAVAVTSPAAAADPAYTDGDYEFTVDASGATITDYTGPAGSVAIPGRLQMSSLLSVPVTAIGDQAFKAKSLTSVTIPDSVASLGEATFFGNQLTSVTIPDAVVAMGDDVFNSNQLASVTLPASITTLPDYAFANNKLTSVTVPTTVTTLGGYAFGWNQLASVTVPGAVTTIKVGAFFGNPLTSVTLPPSVRTVGKEAFGYAGTPTLTEVRLTGQAPTVTAATDGQPSFDTRAGLTVYYAADQHGYTVDSSGRWSGYDVIPLKLAASITATSIDQGAAATISGGTAYPRATVSARLDSDSGTVIGSAAATNTGQFAFPVTIPAGAALGARIVVVTSAFAGITLRQEIPIVITEGDATGPSEPGISEPAACTAAPFKDVKKTVRNCPAITWLKAEGVYTSAKYRPKQQLNRRVVARFLYRLSDVTVPACTAKPTKDVKKGNSFCRPVTWATTHAIIKPTKANNFKPTKAMTRAALADALYRFTHAGAAAPKCTVKPFKDVGKGNRYCGAVTWARDTGVIPGTSATKYKPARVVTRGQAATMMYRAIQLR